MFGGGGRIEQDQRFHRQWAGRPSRRHGAGGHFGMASRRGWRNGHARDQHHLRKHGRLPLPSAWKWCASYAPRRRVWSPTSRATRTRLQERPRGCRGAGNGRADRTGRPFQEFTDRDFWCRGHSRSDRVVFAIPPSTISCRRGGISCLPGLPSLGQGDCRSCRTGLFRRPTL